MLTSPDGKPIRSKTEVQVQLTEDQMIAVGVRLINAQLTTLINSGVTPLRLIEQLVEMTAALLSRFEPADWRHSLTLGVVKGLPDEVARKARERIISNAANGVGR